MTLLNSGVTHGSVLSEDKPIQGTPMISFTREEEERVLETEHQTLQRMRTRLPQRCLGMALS